MVQREVDGECSRCTCCGESGGEGVGPEGGPARGNTLHEEGAAGLWRWVIRVLAAAALRGLEFGSWWGGMPEHTEAVLTWLVIKIS